MEIRDNKSLGYLNQLAVFTGILRLYSPNVYQQMCVHVHSAMRVSVNDASVSGCFRLGSAFPKCWSWRLINHTVPWSLGSCLRSKLLIIIFISKGFRKNRIQYRFSIDAGDNLILKMTSVGKHRYRWQQIRPILFRYMIIRLLWSNRYRASEKNAEIDVNINQIQVWCTSLHMMGK